MSKLAVSILLIILLTGISFVFIIQVWVYAQQQQQPPPQQQELGQENNVRLSQVIIQILQQVAGANPGTNATHIHQILVYLAEETARTASKEEAIKDILQIYSQVATYPLGNVSKSLATLSRLSSSGSNNLLNITQQIEQEKAIGKNVSQSLIDTSTALLAAWWLDLDIPRRPLKMLIRPDGLTAKVLGNILDQTETMDGNMASENVTGSSNQRQGP